jgi:hypothetical protein
MISPIFFFERFWLSREGTAAVFGGWWTSYFSLPSWEGRRVRRFESVYSLADAVCCLFSSAVFLFLRARSDAW